MAISSIYSVHIELSLELAEGKIRAAKTSINRGAYSLGLAWLDIDAAINALKDAKKHLERTADTGNSEDVGKFNMGAGRNVIKA